MANSTRIANIESTSTFFVGSYGIVNVAACELSVARFVVA